MSGTVLGEWDWGLRQDDDSQRTYSITWLVQTDLRDGPQQAYLAPGLPLVGTPWIFGNDNDPWAICRPECVVEPVVTKEPGSFFTVEQFFSTKPLKRCQNAQIENPLLEPVRLGGSFTKYVQEEAIDRHGKVIQSSSFELFKGKEVEFDNNRPNVTVSRNVAALPLAMAAEMVDTVNDADLWGLGPRKVKLSNLRWTRNVYGSCSYYFTVDYEFDINFKTFDRRLVDSGMLCLRGHSPGSAFKSSPVNPDGVTVPFTIPNRLNPRMYEQYKDVNGENVRTLLKSNGTPVSDPENDTHIITFERYEESNFLLLDIPSNLNDA